MGLMTILQINKLICYAIDIGKQFILISYTINIDTKEQFIFIFFNLLI